MADAPAQTKGKRQPSAAFMKPVQPDETLAAVIGPEPVSRTDITKRLWEYIRSKNLQDPENKTFIRADDALKKVFDGRDRVSMFEMTKLVFGHVKAA
jgi:chromatin remodeling complex protein RSC6